MAGILFAASLAVYRLAVVPAIPNRDDNFWYVPAAEQLLRTGDLDLTPLADWSEWQRQHYRRSELTDGRVLNYFPLGPTLVALPMVAIVDRSSEPAAPTEARAASLADLVADTTAALAVPLVFLLALTLASSQLPADSTGRSAAGLGSLTTTGAAALALVFAFATPQLPIHAGGYWSHNPGQTLLVAALLLVAADGGRRAAWSALPLALAYTCRPSTSLAIAAIGCYLLAFAKRQLAAFAALLAAAVLPFVWWSYANWGTWLPPYHLQKRFSPRTFWEALAGHLVSPNRGLLTLAPIFLFALLGAVVVVLAWWRWHRGAGERPPHPLYLVLVALFLGQLVIAALYRKWWGGGSFGPRLLAESFAPLTLLLAPAWAWIAQRPPAQRFGGRLLFGLAVAVSLAIAARGATAPSVYDWNATPRPVDNKPARVWDWRDLQILR